MEIVRGGIDAVPKTQIQAALSLGFSFSSAMRIVVLPQALRSMTPSLVNQAVFMVKATSVVSLFGVTEFLYVSKEQIERTLMGFEIMAIVWVAYTLVCYPLTVLGRRFETRLTRAWSSLPRRGQRMIEISGLRKSYGDRLIIDGDLISVPKGTVCGVLGPSGSGKSTLLRCVNFLENYEAGEIRIDGELVGYDVQDGRRTPKPRREVARMRSQSCMVFQQFNLFSHMTAIENVAAAPSESARAQSRQRIRAGSGVAGEGRSVGPQGRLSRVSVGRRATAGGDRPCAGHAAQGAAARRGDERTRPGAGGRGA